MIVAEIIRYEEGAMDFDEVVSLFQKLKDTGMVFHLQGHYHRQLEFLMEEGFVQ